MSCIYLHTVCNVVLPIVMPLPITNFCITDNTRIDNMLHTEFPLL